MILAARTFVVRSTSIGRPIVQTINPVHIAIVAVIFVITLAAVPVGERLNWAGRMGSALGVDFNKLLEIQKKVRATPNALSVPAVSEGSSTFMLNGGPAQVTTSVVVTVIYRGRPSDPEGFADSIADEVLRLAPDNLGRQRLTIIVRYGFDIGIASGWRTFNYSHTVVEWRARLHGPLPEQPSI
ncbi:MAG TPA: hypothetical protein VHU18_12155 [Rhizomicrobium sp.]|jgi:hypothetical protein|nr:hypothetical protein [Rhizomicrobium sp.]